MSLAPGPTLLALTYIDLVVALAGHEQMGHDAQSLFDDLKKLEPKWFDKLDNPEAKEALRQAAKVIVSPGKSVALQIPGELHL